MRKVMITIGIVGVLIGATAISVHSARDGPAESAKTPVQVKLTSAALAHPEALLCQAFLEAPDQRFSLFDGIIFAGQALSFENKNAQASIELGGSKLVFSIANARDFKLTHGQESFTLQRSGRGYQPITRKLGEGRSYVLAFPYGYIYSSRSYLGLVSKARGLLIPRCGGVQQFTLGGKQFGIYDANVDGFYRIGVDSIGVGSVDKPFNVFAPLGERLATPSGVYQIVKLAEDGSELQYVPYAGETARLSAKNWDSDLEIQAAWTSAPAATSFVAELNSKAPADLRVVPGRYGLRYGLAYSPRLRKLVAAVMPGNLPAVEATAGQPQTVTLGGPFSLQFEVRKLGGRMNIDSSGIHLRGKNGEEYTHFRWTAEPQISLLSDGQTRPLGKMEFG